ncbi:MAG: redoxin domain-containing protein [Pseudomonadota bacterium]
MPRNLVRNSLIAMVLAAVAGIVYVLASAASGPGERIRFERFARGALVGLDFGMAGQPAGTQGFLGPGGETVSMPELTGRVTLVNLWATWCAPCEREMPTLGALQTARGGEAFQVVAISVDELDAREEAARQLAEWTGGQLEFYQANDFDLAYVDFSARGFPTTILYDSDGLEVARYAGELDWASYEALALIDAVIENASG